MNDNPATREPTGYAVTSAELRRIADALDTLPPVDEPLAGQIYLFPRDGGADAVDAILFAIDGTRGKTELANDGWAHSAWVTRNGLTVHVRAKVPAPPDERDAEIERLRAALAESIVRAMPVPNVDQTPTQHMATMVDPTGLNFSREPEVLVAGDVPTGVEGHNEYTGRASVPDMQTRPQCSPQCLAAYALKEILFNQHLDGCPNGEQLVTRYFSFGHGQTDPDTGEHLLDKYATVIAPTVQACKKAMFASRYGDRWAFDYAPDDPQWLEWGPRWTEHDRIVAGRAVPDMQALPQCSPECIALAASGKSEPDRPWHHDSCPNGGE